jgi:hypothetical protein
MPSPLSAFRSGLSKTAYPHLQPREHRSSVQNMSPKPSWLVGDLHQYDAEWFLFWQVSPAARPIRVCGDTVKAQLDFVGTIEEIHHVDMSVIPGDKSEITVERILRLVLGKVRGEPLELVQQFVLDAVGSVIPLPRAAGGTIFASEDVGEVVGLMEALSRCVEASTATDQDGDTAWNELAILLGLDSHVPGRFGNVSRHILSRGRAMLRKDRGEGDGEPLCWVRCAGCFALFPIRLDLRPSAKANARVYRIPGLEYWGTIPNGVGLVIQEGRVVGRMLYGGSTCVCRMPEMVEIR